MASCSCTEVLALLVQVETAKKMINSLVEERLAVVDVSIYTNVNNVYTYIIYVLDDQLYIYIYTEHMYVQDSNIFVYTYSRG